MRTLNSFILEQIQVNGIIYFLLNRRARVAHCRNSKRLYDEANDPVRRAEIDRYVDALRHAGDIK